MGRRMDGWVDSGWIDGWMNGWMDGQTGLGRCGSASLAYVPRSL